MTALMDVTVEQVATLDELVDLAQSLERSISGMMAARDGVLALAARWASDAASDADEADISYRAVAAELATALRVSDRTVQRRMAGAELLVERFPSVWAAQGAGEIAAGHARVIVDAGVRIEDPVAREEYAARVLEFARDESPNRVRPIAERIAQQYQPRSIEERHDGARQERGAWVRDHPDAMAEMHLFGPAALVHGAYDRITAMAKAHAAGPTAAASDADAERHDGDTGPQAGDAAPQGNDAANGQDPRTLAQRRFDIALDLLLTGVPAGHDTEQGLLAAIRPSVSVTIPFLTMMGLESLRIGTESVTAQPAELDGHGPIDPQTARLLAGAASGWDRVLTHPVTGTLLAVDRYRPSEYQRRHLRARDQRCRFPTCGMPARDSDLDHTHDAALGGATEVDNLGALCRRHHVLKHHAPWHVEQLGDGLVEWTSPAGRIYIDRPPPQNTVVFTEEATSTEQGQASAAPF
ncbi:DUF222 domain-containing protein [Microbacterium sp. Mu-80]|uniref:DUF222 domain-containing protein n=1 Tax=Microbacterium bandirmense TaxID=3122050 RepID=A0ABU8L7A4_9MICO